MARGTYVAPSTPVQELLAGIWMQVLKVDRISADDSFFDLGGNSLVATQLISRIRVVLGVEVALESLLDQPTQVFLSGKYHDLVVEDAGTLRFAEKLCVYDSTIIPTSLVYPV